MNSHSIEAIAKTIETLLTYGYRRLAFLLKRNRKVFHHILQIKCWQVRKRQIGQCPGIKYKKSVATEKNQRWLSR